MNDISYRLKNIMEGLSIRKFAERLELSPTTVQEYLKGRTPPADFIVRVCERFKVDSWWLLTGKKRDDLLHDYSVAEGQAVFQIKGQRNGEYQVLDSRTAAIVDYFKALREDDKKAFEQIASTMAHAQKNLKKVV